MSGVEPFLATLFAAAPTAGAAGTAAAGAATGVLGTGLTATELAAIGGAAASVAGTGAQLLQEKPKTPNIPGPANRDDAQREADLDSARRRRLGRGAALLNPAGARGDTSSPNLGSAALLGA